ncbi:MerR family transcriptional regulator [Streptomyces sp. NPDC051776]|uniref:MerR family transcriptional regulator n=1 Tax=Streptomyces sp. NPDC051776 TaxID=3155414 RepID=UPI00342E637B
MSAWRISQLAEITGVPATTLRFYETAGLLPADRTPAGYRVYGEEAVQRLALIGTAKHLGLPLGEIGELLAVRDAGTCADVKADLLPRVTARLDKAERQHGGLISFIDSLRSALTRLEALPDRAGPCGSACGFPDTDTARPDTNTARPDTNTARPDTDTAPPDTDTSRPDAAVAEEHWRTAPVACSLSADGLKQRAGQWRTAVDGAVRAWIPGGVRLTLPSERAGAIAALAAAEQQCCPFLDFRLHLDGRVLHVEVRAPSDGAALFHELFSPTT